MGLNVGYKLTEVGVIPDEWATTTISKLCTVVRGGSPRPAGDPRYFNGSFVPWLTVAALTNIPESNLHVSETVSFLTEEGSKHSRTVQRGTVIIANSGATLGVAKMLAMTCCANDGVAALIGQTKGDKRFLCYYLNSQTKRLREVVATGNGQPNLNTTLIGGIVIPLPGDDEQRAIAEALSDTDALISALDRLVAKKRDIKQAAMQQLLTGNRRLPGFGKETRTRQTAVYAAPGHSRHLSTEWKQSTIGELIREEGGSVQTGPFGTLLKASEYATAGLPLISVGEIGPGVLRIGEKTPRVPRSVVQRLPEYVLRDGDIVFGRKGAVDRSALVCGDGAFLGSDALRLRLPRSCHPPFVACQLQTHIVRTWLLQNAIGTTMASLNQEILQRVSLLMPPTVQEQIAIAAILSDMDAEIAALERRRDKTRLLKQGMMQELLTGRIRLV